MMELRSSPTAQLVDSRAIRVLLVYDNALVRGCFKLLIDSQAGLNVVGETDNYQDAVSLADRERPDVVILDPAIGAEKGLEHIRSLVKASSNSRVLVLANTADQNLDRQALQFGAMGLVSRDDAPDVLLKAIRKVSEGEAWFGRATIGSLIAEFARIGNLAMDSMDPAPVAQIEALTKRERDIIRLVAQGLKNKQIAERLRISEITVRHHLTSIFGKLAVADRFELMIYAYKHGISEIPK
jgi:DNA-binding NarL/FixJ family response regulator